MASRKSKSKSKGKSTAKSSENRYELRQLGMGDIYRQSFSVVLGNIGTLVGLMALVYVPFYLAVHFITQGMLPAEPETLDEVATFPAEAASIEQTITSIAGLVESLIVVPITAASVMFIVAGLYTGERIGIGGALSRAVGRILPLLATYILTGLVICGGLVLLVIPGIVFAVWFLLSTQVAVLEGIAGPKAMGRSRELMRGASAALILLLLGLGLTFVVIEFAATIILAPLPPLVAILGLAIVHTICMLVVQVAWVLYYFSARCRHETFTPEMLRDSLAVEQQPTNVAVSKA